MVFTQWCLAEKSLDPSFPLPSLPSLTNKTAAGGLTTNTNVLRAKSAISHRLKSLPVASISLSRENNEVMPLGQAINNVKVCIYTSMYHAHLFALTSDATAQLSGTSKLEKHLFLGLSELLLNCITHVRLSISLVVWLAVNYWGCRNWPLLKS